MGGRLFGSRILLTGATGGLGRALVEGLLAAGCSQLAVADIDESGLDRLADEFGGGAQRVRSKVLDVRDAAAFVTVADEVVAEWGGIDVLINHAGILSQPARVHNTTFDDFTRVMDVNLYGAFHGMRAVLPHMRSAGSGAIVNTASVAGITAWSHSAPYCVSKAALIHLSRVAGLEYAAEGIRVNCVAPGTVQTAIHEGLPLEVMNEIVSRHPIGRLGKPEELVGAYVYLASPDSTFVTGSVITIDGGYSLP